MRRIRPVPLVLPRIVGVEANGALARPEHEAAGLARNAAYLLRPDTYVALAEPSGRPAALEQYFTSRRIEVAKTAGPREPAVPRPAQ